MKRERFIDTCRYVVPQPVGQVKIFKNSLYKYHMDRLIIHTLALIRHVNQNQNLAAMERYYAYCFFFKNNFKAYVYFTKYLIFIINFAIENLLHLIKFT